MRARPGPPCPSPIREQGASPSIRRAPRKGPLGLRIQGRRRFSMDTDRERELMARIRAGDKTACDECIHEHSPGVYRLAMRLMRHAAEAEDVVQETFLSAFKAIDRFDG